MEITIDEEVVRTAYANADDKTKALLEKLLGSSVVIPSSSVTDRVKTFANACDELGENHPLVKAYTTASFNTGGSPDDVSDVIAHLKLRIVVAALNEGWKPKFVKDERRWMPWFVLYTNDEIKQMNENDKANICLFAGQSLGEDYEYGGMALADVNSSTSRSLTNDGSLLSFKSSELAKYAGLQFVELYRDFMLSNMEV